MFNLREKNSKYGLKSLSLYIYIYIYICMKKLYKRKFSGKSKGGKNNKVLEKLRNQEKDFPVN